MVLFNKVIQRCRLIVLAEVAMVAVTGANAQSYYGPLKGRVTDAQGAAIANAAVVLTDVSTHISRNVVSNGSGEYVFRPVDPGTFTLTVPAENFKSSTQKNVVVATQQTVTIDTSRAVGATSQMVNGRVSD